MCLFIRSDIAFNPEPDLSTDDKLLEESLATVSPNTEFILLGDFNTDLSNKNMTCSLVKEL